jgi:hypothetical protein
MRELRLERVLLGEDDHNKEIEKTPEGGDGGKDSGGAKEVANNLKENEDQGKAEGFFAELPPDEQNKISTLDGSAAKIQIGDCGNHPAEYDSGKGLLTVDRKHIENPDPEKAREAVYDEVGLAAYDKSSQDAKR